MILYFDSKSSLMHFPVNVTDKDHVFTVLFCFSCLCVSNIFVKKNWY